MAVPASLVVSSGLVLVASAYVSTHLLFVVTFIVSYLCLERVLSPELVDGFFREVDAVLLGDLRQVRDAIKDDPLTAPTYAAAEERVRRARTFIANAIDLLETKAREGAEGFSSVKDAATAAFHWLRLGAGVANLLATVLMNAAFEEARSRAPLVLQWRGVKGLRTPPTNEEGAAPESKKDTTLLVVWIAAIVAYGAQVVTVGGICTSIASFGMCFPCFAALCGFALMEAERVYLWGSYAIDTKGSNDTANPTVDAAGDGVKEEDLQDAWGWIWFLTIMGHWIDSILIVYMLGKRPFVLASLAIYNVAGLKAARQAYLAADDADGAHENVNRWRRAALKVLTIDIAKVVATYLCIDFYLGALLFACLFAKAACLLDRAIYLSDDRASGNGDSNQEGSGIAENVSGDAEAEAEGSNGNIQESAGLAEQVAGDAKASEHDNQESASLVEDVAGDTQGSDDDNQEVAGPPGDVAGDAQGSDEVPAENSSGIAACDHEEEESPSEEHTDVSDSEELRREESDCSSSSSMDDWSFVGVDQIMPTDVNGGVDRKFRFFL